MAFSNPTVEAKPILFCIGQLAEISEPKPTATGTYYLCSVKIAGNGASRDQYTNFMFRPEWFGAGFNANIFDQQEGGKGLKFIYRKNIAAREADSLLRAICGAGEEGDELFETLSNTIQAVPAPDFESESTTDDEILEYVRKVVDTIREIVLPEGPGPQLGFKLKQGQDKVEGEFDEAGKPLRVLNDRYEVAEFFRTDAATIARIAKRVEKDNERIPGSAKLTFEV
jgi:hypothetical protein